MYGAKRGPFFESLLEAASSHLADDSPLLAVTPISHYLNSKGHAFELRQFPLAAPFERRLFCNSASIHRNDGSSMPGYSLSSSESSCAVALIEAFERFCFRDILPEHSEIYFEEDELTDAEILDTEWAERFYGRAWNNVSSKYLLGRRIETEAPIGIDRLFVIGDDHWYPSTTSGFACHLNYPHAALSACLEVTERDVLLRNWFSKISPDCSSSENSNLSSLAEELLSLDEFEISLGSYFSNGSYVCTAAVYSDKHRLFFLGTGAHFNQKTASDKAIREALSIWILDYLGLKACGDKMTFSTTNQIRRHAPHFDLLKEFFVLRRSTSAVETAPDALTKQMNDLNQHYQFVLVPITIPEFDNSAVVFMKAFSPRAVPLFKSEFPLLLPPDFATLVKEHNPYHPF